MPKARFGLVVILPPNFLFRNRTGRQHNQITSGNTAGSLPHKYYTWQGDISHFIFRKMNFGPGYWSCCRTCQCKCQRWGAEE